jgi:hypothetical protein
LLTTNIFPFPTCDETSLRQTRFAALSLKNQGWIFEIGAKTPEKEIPVMLKAYGLTLKQ